MSVALARQAPYPTRVQQRRCSKCGKLVSRSAYACRRCGKTQRIRPKTILLCLAAALLVGMFAVASASALLPQAHPGEAAAAAMKAPTELNRGAVTISGRTPEVSATELWTSYTRDAAGADRLYREHSIVVTGNIRSVERNYQGDPVVRLATGALETVNATFATRNDPGLATLAKGHTVSLLCVGRGALIGAPLLGSCFLK